MCPLAIEPTGFGKHRIYNPPPPQLLKGLRMNVDNGKICSRFISNFCYLIEKFQYALELRYYFSYKETTL